MLKNILLYKFLIVNAVAISWLGFSDYQTHWLRKLFFADTTYVNYLTASLFLITFITAWFWAYVVNAKLNYWLEHDYNDGSALANLSGYNISISILWIKEAAGWMLFLGLIGTIYGLMLSISNVNPTNFGTPEGIKQIAVQMVSGLRVELSTTLIGAMTALYIEALYVLLRHAVDYLIHEENS